MEEKQGLVKATTNKFGWNKFCLTENDKIWYSTKEELGFSNGDKISFKYTLTKSEKDGRTFDNYYLSGKATVLEKASPKFSGKPNNGSVKSDDYRNSVDAGNAVERSKDVVVALINKDVIKSTAEIKLVLAELVKEFVAQFEQARDILDGKDKIAKLSTLESQEELPIEIQKF